MDSDRISPSPGSRRASRLNSNTSEDQTILAYSGKKRDEILRACEAKDVHALASLCISEGGLLHDDLRQAVWPILLGYDPSSDQPTSPEWTSLPVHSDEEQVKLDVNRAFVHYPT
ncbi:hypothetical protein ACJ72_05687, partial [Emergomyces africanus]